MTASASEPPKPPRDDRAVGPDGPIAVKRPRRGMSRILIAVRCGRGDGYSPMTHEDRRITPPSRADCRSLVDPDRHGFLGV